MEYNILIKNGMIIDGLGTPAFPGEVAIKDGKIVKVAEKINGSAETIIDAEGMVVSPGFIDPHAHNDGYIFLDPSNMYKLAQGVTTEISGNCGESLFPVSEKFFDETFNYYASYYPTEAAMRNYTTAKNFFSDVKQLPLGNNVGYLCAHGSLRMSSMGFASRQATTEELEAMKAMLTEAMESGAMGMSCGLVYSPGCFADTEELTELCKIVKAYDGVFTVHMRSEGFGLIQAIKEVIEIARKSGVRTIISHLKALGRNFWGMSVEALALIEQAQADGLEIFCDQYPYTTCSTMLHWVIPNEYTEGGMLKMCERLAEPEVRERIKGMFDNKFGPWDNLMENFTPAGIYVLKADHSPDAIGKSLQDYADSINGDPYELLFDIIIADKADVIAAFEAMSEEDIGRIMQKDYCMVGSDGIVVKPEEKTHPRLTSAFPRVLGKYVREENVVPLEKAIRKMTSLTASVLGLEEKGQLSEGYDADICIFNPATVKDTGTLADFNQLPEGIQYVLVNGKVALQNGQYTNAASGNLVLK